jgi:hypothetical protein
MTERRQRDAREYLPSRSYGRVHAHSADTPGGRSAHGHAVRGTAPHLPGQGRLLTTITDRGVPAPNPVWFVPDGDDLVVFSSPHARKVRNIEQRPTVTVHFNSDPERWRRRRRHRRCGDRTRPATERARRLPRQVRDEHHRASGHDRRRDRPDLQHRDPHPTDPRPTDRHERLTSLMIHGTGGRAGHGCDVKHLLVDDAICEAATMSAISVVVVRRRPRPTSHPRQRRRPGSPAR